MPSYNYKNTIEDIAKEYNVAFFAYFGSYQTEYYHKESDIDIAFLPEKNMTIETKVSLMDDLIKYHRKSEIDLLDLRKAEPVLRYEIALNGRVFYEKHAGLFDKYSLFYIKRFYELKPLIEAELRALTQDIKEVLKGAR